jgi:hypothetical protein
MENQITIVDADGLRLLQAHRWTLMNKKTRCGRVYMYLQANVCGETVLFHRLLTNAPPGVLVDHINGNGLDNRRKNLRHCSHAENMRNRRPSASSTLGIKGVGMKNGKFYAQIKAGGVRRYRGGFLTAEEAMGAYATMAAELHGEFARLG